MSEFFYPTSRSPEREPVVEVYGLGAWPTGSENL